ncbi:MAG: type I-E CRISPR-associated protein Cas6/Cse3/CasE [Desulfamplus sp.]|nr:type I-E CRISPR-associated protein Cas6/Cse3/CasE [Desulfamplus sp.]
MTSTLLSFDISKDNMSILGQQAEIKLLKELEDDAEKILDEFLNNIDDFSQTTMESSRVKQKQCLNQWQEQFNKDIHLNKYSSEQHLDIIEKRIFQLTQEKIAAEEKAEEIFHIKEKIEAAFKKIETEKKVAENKLAELEKNSSQELENKDAAINDLNLRLNEAVKKSENRNSENHLLKKNIEKIQNFNADLESQNRILATEIKIDKRELEFTEKKLLNERAELNEKIIKLQKESDSVAREKEILSKEKISAETAYIESQKKLESLEVLANAFKNEITSKEKEIRHNQEKSFQNESIQAKKIQALEVKLYQNDAQQSQKIKELEEKLSDNLNIVHVLDREKRESEESVKKLEKEVGAIEFKNQRLESQIESFEAEKLGLKKEIESLKNSSLIDAKEFSLKIGILEKQLSDTLKTHRKALEEMEHRAQMASDVLKKEKGELGFKVNSENLQVNHEGMLRYEKDGTTRTHNTATFTGKLQVTDRDKFIRTVEKGIGRAKSFGFGLLQIVPISIQNNS